MLTKSQLELLLLVSPKEIRWEDQDHNTDDIEELRKLFRERLYAEPFNRRSDEKI